MVESLTMTGMPPAAGTTNTVLAAQVAERCPAINECRVVPDAGQPLPIRRPGQRVHIAHQDPAVRAQLPSAAMTMTLSPCSKVRCFPSGDHLGASGVPPS